MGVAFVGAGIAGERWYAARQIAQAEHDWELRRSLRHASLSTYLDTVTAELLFWGSDSNIHEAFEALNAGWNEIAAPQQEILRRLYLEENPFAPKEHGWLADARDGSAYSAAHKAFHPRARRFVEVRGYYDLFLISLTGDILYTVAKEDDYATNLMFGPWQTSGLAQAFRAVRDSLDTNVVRYSDLERYGPSHDAPALFAATPIRTETGRRLGVLAMQLPLDQIEEILQLTAGMGTTGETYLVGADGLMRSNSRFSEASTILDVKVDTPTVARALAGETGVAFTDDYRGVPVLSAFQPLELDSTRWALMAEMDRAEVLAPVLEARVWFAAAALGAFVLGLASLRYLRFGA